MIKFSHITSVFIAVLLFSACSTSKESSKKETPLTPATALQHYIENGDKTYDLKMADTLEVEGITVYNLILTSQKWREHIWKHQLTIFVPDRIEHEQSLLFISGGHIDEKGEPKFRGGPDDDLTIMLATIAKTNSAVTAIIRHVPNQPLFGGLVEDQMISFTLHNYKKDGDMTWPLLFPMTKSAIRAMDAVQEFSKKELNTDIKKFVVSGASKRGWTTWLTGASDPRVEAIAPMVIDVLNLPVSLNYQIEVWKDYSVQIEDYVKLEIPQSVESESGRNITTMVDPYSYRKTLTMPKMIFIGTNDEYWPVDAIKNYYDSIPGENYIHYVPNAGHDLGDTDSAPRALNAFFNTTITGKHYPKCSWDVKQESDGIAVTVATSGDELIDAVIWSAESKGDRDFRDEEWSSISLNAKNKEAVKVDVTYPAEGFKAFYIDLIYESPAGVKYTKSTRMFVTNSSTLL